MDAEFEHRINTYSLEELRNLRDLIDREKYPEKYGAVLARIDGLESHRQSITPLESAYLADNADSSSAYFAFRCPNCRAGTVSIWTKLDLLFPKLLRFGLSKRTTTVCTKCGKTIGFSRWAFLFQGVFLSLALYLFAEMGRFIGWLIWLVALSVMAAYLALPVLFWPLSVIDHYKENS